MNRTAFAGFMLLLLVGTFGLAVHQTNANPIVVPIIDLVSPKECLYNNNQIELVFDSTAPKELNITFTSFSYSLDGKPEIPISGNTTVNGLSMGTHSLVVYGRDTEGFRHNSQLVHFDVYISSALIIAIPVLLAIALTAVISVVYIKKRRNKQSN